MRRFRWLGLTASALLFCAWTPARAEETKDLTWSFSGEARFRPEYRDNRDLASEIDDDLRQGFMRLRLGIGVAVKDRYRVFAQVQDSRVAGEEASTASDQKNLDLHQGYVEFASSPSGSLRLTVGRQEWFYGEHRLIGNFGWDNVGRSFDGAKARYSHGKFFLDALLAQVSTTVSGGASTGSGLYGLYSQTAPRAGAEYDAYWLLFDDHTSAAGELPGAFGTSSVHAVGARARDHFGRFDFAAEAVWERGEWRGDDLDAHAFGAQGGAVFGKTARTRLFAGYDFATGDRDPADGRREEFFNFFPTNHPLYGYMDYEGWRNIRSPYAGVSLTRGRHFAQVKAHAFDLDEARGPWKDAAGVVMGFDPTGASGTSVGSEVDLTYRFSWTDKALVEAGWSEFDPGRFARQTRGDDVSRWTYLMLTFAF